MNNKNLKILIVDDNENLCKTLSFILKRKGHTVSIAHDADTGIALYRDDPADIVLSDIIMPEKNGVDMFTEIKKINEKAMVILMTAYSVSDLINKGLSEGAYSILYKPLDIEELIGIIGLSQKHGEGQLVMVIDDDASIRSLLRDFFVRQGYDVFITGSGKEAIEIARDKYFFAVFIDMVMPDMNGLETFYKFRQVSPESKIVMMSGYHGQAEDLMSEATDNGAYAILHKPFHLSDVSSLLKSIVLS